MIIFEALSRTLQKVPFKYLKRGLLILIGMTLLGMTILVIFQTVVVRKQNKYTAIDNQLITKYSNRSRYNHEPCKHLHYMYVDFVGRLGNNMFEFASSQAIASRNNLVPVYDTDNDLFDVFDIPNVKSRKEECTNCKKMSYRHPNFYISAYLYDSNTECIGTVSCYENTSVILRGYYHSWHFFKYMMNEIKTMFKFKPWIIEKATKYLHKNIPSYWTDETFVRIGVHIRLLDRKQEWNTSYLFDAAFYYTQQFSNVQFIVCSDDMTEAKKVFPEWLSRSVLYSDNRYEVDLAILASCNHSIITVGTFGWWGAWLAGGQVVYYSDFPPLKPRYLNVTREQVQKDYYLPQWHPI